MGEQPCARLAVCLGCAGPRAKCLCRRPRTRLCYARCWRGLPHCVYLQGLEWWPLQPLCTARSHRGAFPAGRLALYEWSQLDRRAASFARRLPTKCSNTHRRCSTRCRWVRAPRSPAPVMLERVVAAARACCLCSVPLSRALPARSCDASCVEAIGTVPPATPCRLRLGTWTVSSKAQATRP